MILLRLAAFLIILGLNLDAFAQRGRHRYENLRQHDNKPYHFGFSLGLNQMNFALKPVEDFSELPEDRENFGGLHTLNSVLPVKENGFHIGIVSNLKLDPQLDLRFVPTLSFGDRKIHYLGKNGSSQPVTVVENIESTFIDFPLHLKYKSIRMTNTRVYVIGGLKYSYDLASNQDKKDTGEEVRIRLSRNDLYYDVGVGFDYYFQYFKFSTEIKGSFGLTNLNRPENTIYTNSIDRLNSRIIMISFLFE
jgi:hypothetical protein